MLAVSPQRIRDDEGETEEDEFLVGSADHSQFVDFGDGSLLDCIDFDDLFAEIEGDGELLPGLEMVDHDITAEFSATSGGEESEMNVSEVPDGAENGGLVNDEDEDGDKSASGRDESGTVDAVASNPAGQGGGGGRKKASSVQSKNNPPQAKKKAKVDWTPDLHRRFVQAVEQLGLDKAVPSKILEIMGIECLTRHNIASHLQKYRSHRKHQLAREVENHQRRQMFSGGKTELSPWLINGPAMGFPPVVAAPLLQPLFRPLHVWGHPSADQSAWPQHAVRPLPPASPPRIPWSPVGLGPPYSLPPLLDPTSYWHPHHQQGLMSGPPVPGIPSGAIYKVDPCIGVPTDRSGPQPPPHSHPSKETIDAAIGDALTKPWQPLPLGLKPPSLDGVLTELHRQGIPSIPPS